MIIITPLLPILLLLHYATLSLLFSISYAAVYIAARLLYATLFFTTLRHYDATQSDIH